MTIAHIYNGELGFDVRTKLNDLIDLAGGAIAPFTPGSVLFAGAAGVLAQNNARFFWDNTNFSLNISGTPALYKIPGSGDDNWFVGGSGNFSVSGEGNMGLGGGSFGLLTTGLYNLAAGPHALQRLTTGRNNVAVGINAMSFTISGEMNVAIGRAALDEQDGWEAVGIGDNALGNYSGSGSIGIGAQAAFNLNNGTKNIFIGYKCASAINGPSNRNVWFGGYSGSASTFDDTILFANGDGSIRALDYNLTAVNTWTMVAGAALALRGSTSGTVNINTKAVAGAWTLTLPDTAGTSGYVLSTNGSGVTSWIAGGGGGGMSIGGAITGGTAGRVLFAGVGGILDDDSTFTWDDTNKDLHIGRAYFVNTLPALYSVPHVSGNNWFEGGAGNLSVTGWQNFGTGDGALLNLTSGIGNVALGTSAMRNTQTGVNNMAMGFNSLLSNVLGSNNMAIGASAASNSLGDDNCCIGQAALTNAAGTSARNVAIGSAAGYGPNDTTASVYIGYNSGQQTSASNGDVLIGTQAGFKFGLGSISLFNVVLGANAGQNISGFDVQNVIIGRFAGDNLTGSCSNNTLVGSWRGPSASMNNVIALSDGNNPSVPQLDYNYTTAGRWTAVGDFAIGGKYYIGADPAIFRISSTPENNWFEGNSGNLTVSGYGNFGTGDQSLASVTAGFHNLGVGTRALNKVTSGTENMAFGTNTLANTVTDQYNVAMGSGALQQLGKLGVGGGNNQANVAVGYNALGQMEQGAGNVAIGFNSMSNLIPPYVGSNNCCVGSSAGTGLGFAGSATNNILLGTNAGAHLQATSSYCTFVGGYKGTVAGVGMQQVIALSDGAGHRLFDYGITTDGVWSMGYAVPFAQPNGLHIYNYQDVQAGTANYERVVLDWNQTANVFLVSTQNWGTGTKRMLAIGGFPKAGAPAAGDLPSGSFSVIDDTSAGQTWLVFNKSGTIRKVQLT